MAKKEKPEAEAETKPDSVIYFIANTNLLSPAQIEYLRDKPYITINGAFRRFKNFVTMAFTNQRAYELEKDSFWRLEKEDQKRFVIGGDEIPIELTLMQDFNAAYLIGYDDIRFKQVEAAYKKAENITTQLSKFVLD